MTKRTGWSRRLWRLSLGWALAAGLAGCGSKTFSGDVEVCLDPKLRTPSGIYPSLEVDLVGITDQEEARWTNYAVDQYFEADNRFRADAPRLTMEFSDANHAPVQLSHKDPTWKAWKKRGATRLVVIANLPGVWENKPGALDSRRLILPLDSKKWGSWARPGTIEIAVQPSGLFCRTKMRK